MDVGGDGPKVPFTVLFELQVLLRNHGIAFVLGDFLSDVEEEGVVLESPLLLFFDNLLGEVSVEDAFVGPQNETLLQDSVFVGLRVQGLYVDVAESPH